MDGLNVPGEVMLETEGTSTGRTLEILNLGVYVPHVTHHVAG